MVKTLIAAALLTATTAGIAAAQDVEKGALVFKKCGICHKIGPGATNFSMVEPLEQWVEHGIAPEQVVASHMNNGTAAFTRPLCAYPYEARWKGTGSTDKAENFTCALPARP